jgi:hypothetical protein
MTMCELSFADLLDSCNNDTLRDDITEFIMDHGQAVTVSEVETLGGTAYHGLYVPKYSRQWYLDQMSHFYLFRLAGKFGNDYLVAKDLCRSWFLLELERDRLLAVGALQSYPGKWDGTLLAAPPLNPYI